MDLKRIFLKDACPTSIGGQAIMEGIMMRGPKRTAIAIRLPNGKIHLKTQPTPQGNKWGRIPFVRGVINFVASLVYGTKVLMYSADVLEANYPEEYQKDKFDLWIENKVGKDRAWNILMVLSVVLALVMSIGIFMLLPTAIVGWCAKLTENIILLNLIEGVVRILIFVVYIALISKMQDIKTVFQYHGAEHKCINCIEKGRPLTVHNVMRSSRLHKRCGTSFIFFVMLVSIVLFFFIQVDNVAEKVILRILLMPVVAGISYEIIRLAGRTDNVFIKILSAPGMWIQRMTTREPDESMAEVAIASVEAVFDWKKYLQDTFGYEVDESWMKDDASAEPED